MWIKDQIVQSLPGKFKFSDWNMAFSISASYTWAAAILVGMSMIAANGLVPYLVWFFSNGLAIIAFGYGALKWPALYKVIRLPLFRVIILLVTTFTIWFNMAGMLYVSDNLEAMSHLQGMIFVIIIAALIWSYISFRGGIRISIITDRIQWALVVGGVVVAVIITLASQPELALTSTVAFTSDMNSISDYYNAFWACPLLLTALFTDGMFWQRAPYIKTMKTYVKAYVMFFIYLALAGVLAIFELPSAARWVLFVCIFFAAMSTIDSCMAAYWHQLGKKWGIVVGIAIVGVFYGIAGTDLLNLWWSFFSWFPLFFVIMIVCYQLMKRGIIKEPSEKAIRAADALPVLGDRTPLA